MLKKKLLVLLLSASMAMTMLAGCGSNTDKKDDTKTEASKDDASEAKTDSKDAKEPELEDGTYKVDFNTDSGMFHENPDYNDGKATLTVKDGKMTVHITLNSKNIVQLFLGSAEDAQKDGAKLLEPTTDTVTYSDGMTEEVYGFDIPVPAIDEEFNVALIGKKNKWLIDRGCLELSTSFGSTLNIADIIPLRTFSFCINSLKQKSTVGNIIKSSEFRDSATCVLSFCFPAVWVFNVCVFLLSFF